jgi:hypothetical protein
MLAAIRPGDWNVALLFHVGGAMLLVGFLTVAALSFVRAAGAGRPDDTPVLARVGFRTLLLGALPAYVVMRVGAEWIASRENVSDDAAWIGIGYIVSDLGLLLLLMATFIAARSSRRARDGGTAGRAAAILSLVLLVAYAVAVWAMTAKPG